MPLWLSWLLAQSRHVMQAQEQKLAARMSTNHARFAPLRHTLLTPQHRMSRGKHDFRTS